MTRTPYKSNLPPGLDPTDVSYMKMLKTFYGKDVIIPRSCKTWKNRCDFYRAGFLKD